MRWKDRFKGFAEEAVAEHGGRPQAIFAGFVTATAGIILFIFGLDAFLQDENSGIELGDGYISPVLWSGWLRLQASS